MKIIATLLICLGLIPDVFSQTYTMTKNQVKSITTCSGILYDSCGSSGLYSPNENATLIIYSGNATKGISVTFTQFTPEQSTDIVTNYSGNGFSVP
jgi:hypothetical protein